MGLHLVQIDFDELPTAVFYFTREDAAHVRKLRKYRPTRFKATDSVYDKTAADHAVAFVEALCHTKGTWAEKPFEAHRLAGTNYPGYLWDPQTQWLSAIQHRLCGNS